MHRIGWGSYRSEFTRFVRQTTLTSMFKCNNTSSNHQLLKTSYVAKFLNWQTATVSLACGSLLGAYLWSQCQEDDAPTEECPADYIGEPRSEVSEKNKAALMQANSVLGTLFRATLNTPGVSQTDSDFFENIESVLTKYEPILPAHPKIVQLLSRALEQEREVCRGSQSAEGPKKYVMYHGQPWIVYWYELLYTKLWELKHNTHTNNYLFTRFYVDTDCLTHSQAQYFGALERKEQIHGEIQEYTNKVFLVYSLFCNIIDNGSDPIHYVLYNTCNSDLLHYDLMERRVFEKFGLESFYDQNEREIHLLKEELLKLTPYGNLLQVIFPENHIQKSLYPSGYRAQKVPHKILGYGYTSDVSKLVETLIHEPTRVQDTGVVGFNRLRQFCWIATPDTLVRAIEDGVEVHSFNTAEPEKLANVTSKLEELLQRVQLDEKGTCETPRKCYKDYKKLKELEWYFNAMTISD